MRKQRTRADTRSKLLPTLSISTEVLGINEQHKVRIPDIDHSSGNIAHPGKLNRPLHHPRNTHLTLDQVKRIRGLNHMATPHSAMRPKRHILKSFATRQPRSNTASPIARKLRLAAIRIEQPQKQIAIRSALKELNAIRAYARIARAKLPCQLCMSPLSQMFVNNQKVVTAGVGFYERNHSFYSASTSRKATT